MKERLIIGNWKSHKTIPQAVEWLRQIKDHKDEIPEDKTVIICPSFTLLYTVSSFVREYSLPFKIGAQDISPFPEGAFTGEVNGKQIKEFAEYVIIGHSERRRYFSESDETLAKKVSMAHGLGLTVIYCVPDAVSKVPDEVRYLAYEPVKSIGTGNPDTPEHAEAVAKTYCRKHPRLQIIYGGSVVAENVASFTNQPSISGVLPGGASLNPAEFLDIVHNA